MLAIRIKPDIQKRLCDLSDKTGRTKSFYVQQALQEFLDDEEDGLIALERFNNINSEYISFDDVLKKLGINKNELDS
jgi:RHH-type rel operon transcriptional repressor/antitoxin RelB